MDYYLNEYSLRGQFSSVDDFFESLRSKTLPVLKKIHEQKENIIWKKDTFWQSEICAGITLTQIPKKKNERSGELANLQIQLIRLAYEAPFWESDSELNIRVKEYKFDEENRDNFEAVNCFTEAIENEGRVISFIHPAYSIFQLPVVVENNGNENECDIDNIYAVSWWDGEPEIKKWEVSSKYLIQIRAKEFEYHPPHFHAIHNEFEAVFKLSDGELYKHGKKRWTSQMITEIHDWYKIHKEELQESWRNLHNS